MALLRFALLCSMLVFHPVLGTDANSTNSLRGTVKAGLRREMILAKHRSGSACNSVDCCAEKMETLSEAMQHFESETDITFGLASGSNAVGRLGEAALEMMDTIGMKKWNPLAGMVLDTVGSLIEGYITDPTGEAIEALGDSVDCLYTAVQHNLELIKKLQGEMEYLQSEQSPVAKSIRTNTGMILGLMGTASRKRGNQIKSIRETAEACATKIGENSHDWSSLCTVQDFTRMFSKFSTGGFHDLARNWKDDAQALGRTITQTLSIMSGDVPGYPQQEWRRILWTGIRDVLNSFTVQFYEMRAVLKVAGSWRSKLSAPLLTTDYESSFRDYVYAPTNDLLTLLLQKDKASVRRAVTDLATKGNVACAYVEQQAYCTIGVCSGNGNCPSRYDCSNRHWGRVRGSLMCAGQVCHSDPNCEAYWPSGPISGSGVESAVVSYGGAVTDDEPFCSRVQANSPPSSIGMTKTKSCNADHAASGYSANQQVQGVSFHEVVELNDPLYVEVHRRLRAAVNFVKISSPRLTTQGAVAVGAWASPKPESKLETFCARGFGSSASGQLSFMQMIMCYMAAYGCLSKDTMLRTTADSSTAVQSIQDLAEGSTVAVYDWETSSYESSEFFGWAKKSNATATFLEFTTASGAKVKATEHHYLVTSAGLKQAHLVDPAVDQLVSVDGLEPIASIVKIEEAGLYAPLTVVRKNPGAPNLDGGDPGDVFVTADGLLVTTYAEFKGLEPEDAHHMWKLWLRDFSTLVSKYPCITKHSEKFESMLIVEIIREYATQHHGLTKLEQSPERFLKKVFSRRGMEEASSFLNEEIDLLCH